MLCIAGNIAGTTNDEDICVNDHRASACKLLYEISLIRGFAEPTIMNTIWKSISFIVKKYPRIMTTTLDVNALVEFILTELANRFQKLKETTEDVRDTKRSLTVVRFLIKHLQPLCATYTSRMDAKLRSDVCGILIELYNWSDIDSGVVNISDTAMAVAEHLPPMLAFCLQSLCASDPNFWTNVVAEQRVSSKDFADSRKWTLLLSIAIQQSAWPDDDPEQAMKFLFSAVEQCYAGLSSCSALVIDVATVASRAEVKRKAVCSTLYDRVLACGQHILAKDPSSVAMEAVLLPHVICARSYYTRQLAKDLWCYYAKHASGTVLLSQAVNLATAAVRDDVDTATSMHLCDVASSVACMCTSSIKHEFFSTFRANNGVNNLCAWAWLHVPSCVPADQQDTCCLALVQECIQGWRNTVTPSNLDPQNPKSFAKVARFVRVLLNVVPHTTLKGAREASLLVRLLLRTFEALESAVEINADGAAALLRLAGFMVSYQPQGSVEVPQLIASIVHFLDRADTTLTEHAVLDLIVLQQSACGLDPRFADVVGKISTHLCADIGREKWLLWTQCLQSFLACMQSSDDDMVRVLSGACTPAFMTQFKTWVQLDNQKPLPWEGDHNKRNTLLVGAEVSRLQSNLCELQKPRAEGDGGATKRRRIQPHPDRDTSGGTVLQRTSDSPNGSAFTSGEAHGMDSATNARNTAEMHADGECVSHQQMLDALRRTVQQTMALHCKTPFSPAHAEEIHGIVDGLRTGVHRTVERNLTKFAST